MLENAVDVVLIYPKTGMDFGPTVAPPYALLTIAAPLHKDGCKIKIIDQRVDKQWEEHLLEALMSKPICVGISCMTGTQIYFALKAARIVRTATDGNIPIVFGGTHPTILPEQTIKNEYVDIVCVGEGDITFPELVRALQSNGSLAKVDGIVFKNGSNIVMTTARPLLDVETLLPTPWELIDVESYIHRDLYLKESCRNLDIGQTSRGCPFNCGFCSSASIRQRKWRAMSVEKSLHNIVEAVRRFKLTGVWIRDDEFYINRERASKICEGMIRENLNIHWYTSGTRIDVFNKATDEQVALLKRSGAYVLKYGAESGSNRILQLINKGITIDDTIKANLKAKKHGIIPAFALMIGFPTETPEETNQTIDLSFRLRKDNPAAQLEAMAIYTALPGTPMYKLAIENGLKPPESFEDWANWNFDEYDLPGKRIPWFDYKRRKELGNISYMGILSNAIPNMIDSINNVFIRYIVKFLYMPLKFYYRLRLKKKWYTRAPDLAIIKFIRGKIFYKSYLILK